ncbi:MAG: CPBP family intramembrane glutamic endopeptidase [Verrucomicrobiia bacterium]
MMTKMASLFEMHVARVKRHPVASGFVFIYGLIIMLEGFWLGEFARRAAYLAALVAGTLILDRFHPCGPGGEPPLPVRRPKLELSVAGALLLVSVVWLGAHFQGHFIPANRVLKLLWAALALLSVLNIGLALFELLVVRYRLNDLGIRFRGLAPVPLVILCFGATALASNSGVTWHEVVREANGRVWLVPLVSFFAAALPEEFFRMIWQTRLGAVLKNPATGWLIASVIWSFLHVPNFSADASSCLQALRSAFDLVPLGLFWGYATHRSQSLLPAICLHGTNFWGLQNF